MNVSLPQEGNCRLVPGLLLTSPAFGAALKVLGLGGTGRPGPVPFLVDNERGGRIVGVVPFRIPLPGLAISASGAPALGFMAEVSASLGTQLVGVSGDYPRGFTIPGTDIAIRQIGLTIVPAENRFGGGATIHAGGFRIRGEFEVANQRISRISASVALPRPGVAVFPPTFSLTGIGFGFQPARSFSLPTGGTITLPTTLSGTAGWSLFEPTRRFGVGGDMTATLGTGCASAANTASSRRSGLAPPSSARRAFSSSRARSASSRRTPSTSCSAPSSAASPAAPRSTRSTSPSSAS
jgi:hypothetical protein